jgi:hypothetical protein
MEPMVLILNELEMWNFALCYVVGSVLIYCTGLLLFTLLLTCRLLTGMVFTYSHSVSLLT